MNSTKRLAASLITHFLFVFQKIVEDIMLLPVVANIGHSLALGSHALYTIPTIWEDLSLVWKVG